MVKIQLETGYLDVAEGTAFPITLSVADIRDLTKKKGTFSKSIEIPGTQNNHNLLGHYYDVNVSAGSFDINAVTSCNIIVDDIAILNDLVLQLVSVNKKEVSAALNEKITYTVLVKSVEGDFFTKIDQSKLTDIYVNDLDHVFNSSNIVASWSNTYTDGYVYPLGVNPTNNYPISEFRPAIYLRTYWDRIHAAAGYQWEWTDRNDFLFDKLVIPYNGDQPNLNYLTSYFVEATHATDVVTVTGTSTGQQFSTSGTVLTSWTEVSDVDGLFTPATGVWDCPFYITQGQSVGLRLQGIATISLNNTTAANAFIQNIPVPALGEYGYKYTVGYQVLKNGVLFFTGDTPTSANWFPSDGALAAGSTTIANAIPFDVTIPLSNLATSDDITIRLYFKIETVSNLNNPTIYNIGWYSAASGGTAVQVDASISVASINAQFTLASNTLSSGQTIRPADFIPQSIMQKDLIKGICSLFNLYIEQDPTDPNKLIYKTRDQYYDDGSTKDWTNKLAKDRDQIITFLPELTGKKTIYTYKEDKDSYNVAYKDAIKEIYGQVEYTYDNEYVRAVSRHEIIFSPTPMVKTAFGAVVPAIVGSAPKTNIRLLIHNGTTSCNTFNVYDYGTSGQAGLTSYPIVSHFNDPFNPTFDLNFGICDYYFYPGIQPTSNNVFNLCWRRTTGQLNSGRMLTAMFDLRSDDVESLKLSDKIRIENSWWHINKVIDYQVNLRQLTKVELISTDEEIDLPTFIRKVNTDIVYNRKPWKELTSEFYLQNNVIASDEDIIIQGVGNVILPGVGGIVRQDFYYVERSGIWINGREISLPVSDESPVTILTAAYTATYEDRTIDITSGTFDIDLPPATGMAGFKFNIHNSGSGVVTVVSFGSETINADPTVRLIQWDAIRIISNGSNWLII